MIKTWPRFFKILTIVYKEEMAFTAAVLVTFIQEKFELPHIKETA